MSISDLADRETEADRDWLAQRLRTEPRHLRMPRGHTRALVETLQLADQHDLRLFFLLCVEFRPTRGRVALNRAPLMTWWAPNDNGYAQSLLWAGRYTAERLADRNEYYRLWPGKNARCMALPTAIAEEVAVPKPDPGDRGFWTDGPGPLVPNHKLLWDFFEAHAVPHDDMFALALKEGQRCST